MHKECVTLDQVKSAMLVQLDDDIHGRGHRLLGTILFDEGMITEEQIAMVLKDMKKTIP